MIRRRRIVWSFFFFQAEDGIRDGTVTGVQTCALPISAPAVAERRPMPEPEVLANGGDDAPPQRAPSGETAPLVQQAQDREIGRASCRERGWDAGGAGSLRTQKWRL